MAFFQVEKEIGEKRMMTFHGAGLSVGPKISLPEIAAGCEKSEEVGCLCSYIYSF